MRSFTVQERGTRLARRHFLATPTAWVSGRPGGVEDVVAQGGQLTEWLGGVRIAPRFPSPLSKST